MRHLMIIVPVQVQPALPAARRGWTPSSKAAPAFGDGEPASRHIGAALFLQQIQMFGASRLPASGVPAHPG